jgi:hypothetical protein
LHYLAFVGDLMLGEYVKIAGLDRLCFAPQVRDFFFLSFFYFNIRFIFFGCGFFNDTIL